MTNCTRTFNLDRKQASGNIFPATLTTSDPVRRSFGYEVLDMERLDLSRNPFPLIEGHDQSRLNIGVVENVRIEGDRLRGDLRLGSTDRAKEVAEDIRAGIVTGISVGYSISDPIRGGEREDVDVWHFAAEILEVSLVSVPADKRAGINRSKSTMSEQVTDLVPDSAEQKRLDSIRQIAEKFDLEELSFQAMTKGWTVEQFNQMALTEIQKRNNSTSKELSLHEPTLNSETFCGLRIEGDPTKYRQLMENYSLTRLLRGLADPKKMNEAALELGVSQAIQGEFGSRGNTVTVPFEALEVPQTRSVQIGDAAGGQNLKPIDHLGGSFIDVLRNRSMVMQLNPTVMRGLQGDLVIPRKLSGSTPYWIEGDDNDALTQSDITLDQVSMSPKTLGGAVTFSHKMMLQSSPDVESMVRRDLADMIATEIDNAALNAPGTGHQPLGILNQTGIQTQNFTSATPTFEEVCEMEALMATQNIDVGGSVAWLMDPDMAKALRTTPRQGSGVEGNFIWESNGSGRVLDLPAYRTNHMPSGHLLLANWQHLLVGFWGGIEIDVDPYGSNFLKGSVTVRILADIDIAVRHPVAFVLGSTS